MMTLGLGIELEALGKPLHGCPPAIGARSAERVEPGPGHFVPAAQRLEFADPPELGGKHVGVSRREPASTRDVVTDLAQQEPRGVVDARDAVDVRVQSSTNGTREAPRL